MKKKDLLQGNSSKFIGAHISLRTYQAIKKARNKLDLDNKSEVVRMALIDFCNSILNKKIGIKNAKRKSY